MDALFHHLTATAGLLWLLFWYCTCGLLLALFRAVRDAVLVVLCGLGLRAAWRFDAESERIHNEQVAERELALADAERRAGNHTGEGDGQSG